MSFDVFVSYSTKDSTAAKAACAALEAAKIRCWMAPRDIVPGARWGASIVRAINECRVMVLIFSGNANTSAQVHREVDQAFGKGKAVLPLRIEDIRPADELAYYLDTVHWLDALTPPMERNLETLVATVQRLLPATEPVPPIDEPVVDDALAAQAQDEARAEDERRLRQAEAAQSAEAAQREHEAAEALRQNQESEAEQRAEELRKKTEADKQRAEAEENRKRDEADARVKAAEAQQRAEAVARSRREAEQERQAQEEAAKESADVEVAAAKVPGGTSPRRSLLKRAMLAAGVLIAGSIGVVLAIFGYQALAQWQWQRTSSPARMISDPQLGEVNSISFSADGTRIVTSSNTYGTNCKSREFDSCEKHAPSHGVRVWDVSSGAVILTLTGAEDDRGAVFSPDGREIAWDDGKDIKIADAVTGRVTRTIAGAKGLRAFSADSQLLLTDTQIWNASTGRLVVRTFPEDCIPAAAFSPDAKRIVTWDGSVPPKGYNRSGDQSVCDAQSGQTLVTLSISSTAKHLAFFPDGNRLIGTDSFLRIWDAKTGSTIKSLPDADCASMSADGKLLAGAWFNTVSLWNGDSYDLIRKLYSPLDLNFHDVVLSPDGRRLVGTDGSQIELWDLEPPRR